jgi:hypothetical protein
VKIILGVIPRKQARPGIQEFQRSLDALPVFTGMTEKPE